MLRALRRGLEPMSAAVPLIILATAELRAQRQTIATQPPAPQTLRVPQYSVDTHAPAEQITMTRTSFFQVPTRRASRTIPASPATMVAVTHRTPSVSIVVVVLRRTRASATLAGLLPMVGLHAPALSSQSNAPEISSMKRAARVPKLRPVE